MKKLFDFKRSVFALGLAAALLAPVAASAASIDIIEHETGVEQPNPGDGSNYSFTVNPTGITNFTSSGGAPNQDRVFFSGQWDANGAANALAVIAVAFMVDPAAPTVISDVVMLTYDIVSGTGILQQGFMASHSDGSDLNAEFGISSLPAGVGVLETGGLVNLRFYDAGTTGNGGNYTPVTIPNLAIRASSTLPVPGTLPLLAIGGAALRFRRCKAA